MKNQSLFVTDNFWTALQILDDTLKSKTKLGGYSGGERPGKQLFLGRIKFRREEISR